MKYGLARNPKKMINKETDVLKYLVVGATILSIRRILIT